MSSVCKSALFHLRNIAKIRMYLTSESTKTLVHAYVTCRLDNCNSLLLGSTEYIIFFFLTVKQYRAFVYTAIQIKLLFIIIIITEDAHITRFLGIGLPKTWGCPYHCNTSDHHW